MAELLDGIAPGLARLLVALDDGKRRQLAQVAAEWAMERADVPERTVSPILDALRKQRWGDSEALAQAEQIVHDLDVAAWDLQDASEAGTATPADYDRAFRCARAANALASALFANAWDAALHAIYEAYFAGEEEKDWPDLRRELERALED